MSTEVEAFSFGKNWDEYFRASCSEERIEIARRWLLEFLGTETLSGKRFIDIGSGSGINSAAAFKSGAQQILSFDIDPFSVATTTRMRELFKNPEEWEIRSGSILEADFISAVEPADIVYSWGVLHHTGKLWLAIANAASLIKPGGQFYIAIYVKDRRSEFWIRAKKFYNRSNKVIRTLMELGYMGCYILRGLPFGLGERLRYIRDYKKSRGMAYWTDVKDWLGGWPYEPATKEEICDYCENKLGLRTIKVRTGEANIEYLFERPREA